MNATERAALTKLVSKSAASDVSTFSITETDTESAKTALEAAKALIGRKKGDYAIVVLRR